MLLGRGARSCLVAALCSLVSSLSRDAGRLQRVFLPHTRLSPSVLVELRGEGAELRGGGAGLAHYLTTVLRMKAGHSLRAFNGSAHLAHHSIAHQPALCVEWTESTSAVS